MQKTERLSVTSFPGRRYTQGHIYTVKNVYTLRVMWANLTNKRCVKLTRISEISVFTRTRNTMMACFETHLSGFLLTFDYTRMPCYRVLKLS